MKKIETKTAVELHGDADTRVKIDLVFGSRTFVDVHARSNKWQITGSEGLRKAHFACGEDWRTHVCLLRFPFSLSIFPFSIFAWECLIRALLSL